VGALRQQSGARLAEDRNMTPIGGSLRTVRRQTEGNADGAGDGRHRGKRFLTPRKKGGGKVNASWTCQKGMGGRESIPPSGSQ